MGSLNLLEASGPVQACKGIALPVTLLTCTPDETTLTADYVYVDIGTVHTGHYVYVDIGYILAIVYTLI
jgi:hypothetical protein